ncbi:E3 ubiquitin-protein ligase CCNB1IP1-like [Pocillopora damicornis]|uniref:E3 ubiquitin-protein ligase CCNB1IP1-like n=1 Tax=Pocillopora damicornis TaxID=46731 RepID=UPI000F557338|nr:E3 ubiquitin-protein ligase CCNB1IP1-like [Pocillopora damicornis]
MDNDLLCNFRKCRKRLNTHAWVTSCSHIFCDEDGTREFNKSLICPACETNLSAKFDVIRVDLQASEQFKSMVLAGQKPEVIMEICSRALAFWTYQTHQEKMYQDYVANKAKEKTNQLEQYYSQVLSKVQAELSSLRTQTSNDKKELEDIKKRNSELSEKMMEKNRQYLKLQGMYDSLRRKTITPSVLEGREERILESRGLGGEVSRVFEIPLGTGGELLRRTASSADVRYPAEREFHVFDPPVPVSARVSTPSHGPLNDADSASRKFTLDFTGTPGISKRLGQKGAHKE